MFYLIKSTILLGLVIGVVLLGVRIHNKTSEIELDLVDEKSQVNKQITTLKEKTAKEMATLKKIYKKAKDSLEKDAGAEAEHEERGKADNEPSPLAGVKKSLQKPVISIDPLDEEDRKLTAEILGKKGSVKIAADVFEYQTELATSVDASIEQKALEPLDMSRLSGIRDLYLAALETLDCH